MRRLLLVLLAATLVLCAAAPGTLRLSLRSRVEPFKGSGQWEEAVVPAALPIAETAVVICDMWDRHWCRGASERVTVLAKKMAPVIDLARDRGVLIIHAPSETMAFYKDTTQRQAIQNLPMIAPPEALALSDPPLPIDDSDGGCDTGGDKFFKAWRRQHEAIRIGAQDLVSDSGAEIYSALKQRGIRNLLVMGVHTNMCILKRSFAIRQMTKWGIRCILVRDLTDAMYDPQDRPFVSHDRGTELVIQHIETHWAPTVLSTQLTRALLGK